MNFKTITLSAIAAATLTLAPVPARAFTSDGCFMAAEAVMLTAEARDHGDLPSQTVATLTRYFKVETANEMVDLIYRSQESPQQLRAEAVAGCQEDAK